MKNGRSKPMCLEKNPSQFYAVHHKSHTDFSVSKAVKGGSPQWCIGAWDMALVSWQHCIVVVINTAYSIQHISNVTLSSLHELQIQFLVLTLQCTWKQIFRTHKRYNAGLAFHTDDWLVVWKFSLEYVCAVGSPGWQPLTQREDSDQLLNEPSMTA